MTQSLSPDQIDSSVRRAAALSREPDTAVSAADPVAAPGAAGQEAAGLAGLASLASLGLAPLLAGCGAGIAPEAEPAPAQEKRLVQGATVRAGTTITTAAAARFLAQAAMGGSRAEIAGVQAQGYARWIDAQMAMPRSGSRWDWLIAKGYNDPVYLSTQTGFDPCAWRKMITAPDTLRQRVTLALSEICVVGIDGLAGANWRAFSAAAYLDILEDNAFGNYRTLLDQISTSTAMGQFLTFRGNAKQNTSTGALPDENYARELMQLFTIGLIQLNPDGSPIMSNGVPLETYGLSDITGLARVFTGWDFDLSGGLTTATPDFLRRPMAQVASRHETGASTFLGATIPAGLTGAASLKLALDTIFAHPNIAPFISRQLIQKLVTSNPGPSYISRVAAVFSNDGFGVRGNLAAVVSAILLDPEARSTSNGPHFGKLREPMLRFVGWARAYGANSASDLWAIGNTTDAATKLGQSPLRSPSVFNFFRPGYVPPNGAVASAGLQAPEFQLINETSVVGYVNYMQRAVSKGVGDVLPDYSSLLPLAADSQALLNEINLVLAAGQLSSDTLTLLRGALDTMSVKTAAALNNRIYAALTMVMAAPEFLVLQ